MSKVANSLALNLASFCRPWGKEEEKGGEQRSECTGRSMWPGGGLTWLRVAEYSGLTGRKGTALRSVTSVLWFCVVSQTAGRHPVSDPGAHRAGAPGHAGCRARSRQDAGAGAGPACRGWERSLARLTGIASPGHPAGLGSPVTHERDPPATLFTLSGTSSAPRSWWEDGFTRLLAPAPPRKWDCPHPATPQIRGTTAG